MFIWLYKETVMVVLGLKESSWQFSWPWPWRSSLTLHPSPESHHYKLADMCVFNKQQRQTTDAVHRVNAEI